MAHDPEPQDDERRTERPDWLTGPEEAFGVPEGLERAHVPTPRPAVPRPEGLVHREVVETKLARPEGLVQREPPRPRDTAPEASIAPGETDLSRPTLKAWSARASSIPTLRRDDEPADETAPQKNAPAASESIDLPGDSPALERLVEATKRPAATPRALLKAAPKAAWYEHALTRFLTDRRLQIGAAVLGGVVVLAMISSGLNHVTTHHLADMHEHSDRYDGQVVTVDGRVGEVFPIADGWAFYLHQGRDTIVAFARASKPVERSTIRFRGRVSTGFLDGVARQALFEEPPEEK